MNKKFSMLFVISLISFGAKADIIKCIFTEPFITTIYSMSQSTLTIQDPNLKSPKVLKDVSFQIKAAGKFELVSKEGKILQKLDLNNKGSDGMSEHIYPFEVQDFTWSGDQTNPLWGGCSSNSLKTKFVEP